jgi:hypothetical protein
MRPVLCRERRGSQGNPAGRFADLDSRALLPAMITCGRGTETPQGAWSGNIPQRQSRRLRNKIINEKSEFSEKRPMGSFACFAFFVIRSSL